MTQDQVKRSIISPQIQVGPHKAALVKFVDIWYDSGGIMLSAAEAENYEMMARSFGTQCLN